MESWNDDVDQKTSTSDARNSDSEESELQVNELQKWNKVMVCEVYTGDQGSLEERGALQLPQMIFLLLLSPEVLQRALQAWPQSNFHSADSEIGFSVRARSESVLCPGLLRRE